MTERLCIACRQLKDRKDLIKITSEYSSGKVIINPNSLTFGRSAYLCYNESCIEAAFKNNKLAKHLKTAVSGELKGQILNELRDN